MGKKRHTPEQIIGKLREAEVALPVSERRAGPENISRQRRHAYWRQVAWRERHRLYFSGSACGGYCYI
jgi:hypothetical protein